MISIAHSATLKLLQLLTAPTGLNTSVAQLAQAESLVLPPIPDNHFFTDNVSSDLAEKSIEPKYPAIYIYCDKMVNALREKFRSFSGSIQMAVEVRVSQDRLEGIDRMSQLYTDAVTQTLAQGRGDWGQGLFHTGSYDISFGPVKHGGRNFIKTAKVSFEVDASVG